MAIKKINTDLQIEAGLLDGDGNSGVNNQILISTGTGVDWVNASASSIIGGPYLPLTAGSSYPLTGDLIMTQSSGNNILFINSSGGGNPVMYMQDSTRKWGQYVSNGDLFFKDETSTIESLKLDGGNGNAIFAGDINVPTGKSIYMSGTNGLRFIHDGTNGNVINSTGDLKITNGAIDKDIIFRGNDGGSSFAALTLDMSDNGKAYFNYEVQIGSLLKIPSLIYHINDLDTYFGFTAEDTFKVITGGTEALHIDNSQNATFAGDVTVAGKVTAQEFHTEFVSASIMYESGSTKFGDTVDDNHDFTGSLEVRMTDTPGSGKRSFIASGSSGVRLQRKGDSNGWAMEYGFNANDGTDLKGFGGYGTGNSYLQYHYIGGTFNNPNVAILAGGNVGIGTTNPSEKLEVQDGNIKIETTANVDAELILNPYSSALGTTYQWELVGKNSTNGYNLQIRENGTPYVTIDSSVNSNAGFVGIGTSSPGAKLDVNGNVYINSNYTSNAAASDLTIGKTTTGDHGLTIVTGASNTAGIFFADNNNNDAGRIKYQHSNNSMRFETNRSEAMRIEADGNVGIGTTDPEVKLDVRGQILVAGDTPVSRIGSTLEVYRNGTTAELSIHQDDSTTSSSLFSQLRFRNGGNDTYFKVPQSGNGLIIDVEGKANAFAIDINGNVGINNTDPTTKLSINDTLGISGTGNDTYGQIDLVNTQTGTSGDQIGPFITFRGKRGAVDTTIAAYGAIGAINTGTTGNSTGALTFLVKNAVGAAEDLVEQMRITTGGNVGIGTTSPAHVLDVADSGINTTAPTIRLTNSANYNAAAWGGNTSHAIEFYSSDPSGNRVASTIENIAGIDKGGLLTGNLVFKTRDYPTPGTLTEKMRIAEDGNVGIGTPSPDGKLVISNSGAAGLEFFPEYTTNNNLINSYNRSNATYVTIETRAAEYYWDIGTTNKMSLSSSGNLNVNGDIQGDSFGGPGQGLDNLLSLGAYDTSPSAGILIATNIVTNNYGFIFGTIKIEQFNFTSKQTIEFSATVNSNGTLITKDATSDVAITFKIFNYLNKWYFWFPMPSTYSTCTAFINTGAGYQGQSKGFNEVSAVTVSAVPSSGVTNSYDITPRVYLTTATPSGNLPGGPYLPLSAGSSYPLTGTLYGTSTNFSGSGDYAGSMTLGTGASTAEAHLTIGQGRTDSGFSYIDLVGGTTYPDYGLRIIRGNTGANATSGIYHRGTGDLEMQTTDSASILLKTNNTLALTLTNTQKAIFTGNVGIGTTSPSAKLEVRATAATHKLVSINRANSDTAALYLGNDSNNDAVIAVNNGELRVGKDVSGTFSEYVRIDPDGKVGIGTDSPVSPLTIKSNSVSSGESALTIQANGSTDTIVKLGERGGNGGRLEMFDSGVAKIGLFTDGNDNYIKAGNVGIGTTSPAAGLQVAKGGTTVPTAGSSTASAVFGNSTSDNNYGVAIGANSSGVGYISSQRTDGTATTYNLAVQPNGGNVGIGTTSVTAADGLLKISAPSGNGQSSGISLYGNNGNLYGGSNVVRSRITSLTDGTAFGAELTFSTNDTSNVVQERMRIDSSGNVGIGTTTPGDKLHVVGTVQSLNYLLPSTNGTAGWYKIGTLGGFVQGGSTAVIEIAGHTGYNATNNQDYLIKLFIKTSNGNGGGPDGQGFNSWYERTGGNASTVIQFKWNNSATNDYDLYMYIPVHSLRSWYSINKGTGTWEHTASSATDPGANSSSVLKATSLFNILDANVGIGTTSPGEKLEVDGNIKSKRITLSHSGYAGYINQAGDFGGGPLYIRNQGQNHDINFQGNKGGTTSTSLHIDGLTHNIGIGTTNPGEKLEVAGKVRIFDAGYPYIDLGVSTSNYFRIIHDNPNDILKIGKNGATTSSSLIIQGGTGNVGIGGVPGAKLDIEGDLQVKGVNISNQENLDVDTGTETIATVVKANYDAAFFDFVIKNGTNLRAGTVFAIHDGTIVEFTETSTNDLGNTSDVKLSVDISGTDLRLRATTTSDNWIIKSLVRTI